jgi:hypothetical protein
MCGIVGIQFLNDNRPEKAREFIENLLLQSKIRGLHATGAAASVGGEIRVLKAAVPAQKFLLMPEWAAFHVDAAGGILNSIISPVGGYRVSSFGNKAMDPRRTRQTISACPSLLSIAHKLAR